jgi:ABC-type antimicrobial peptide transport system permease subunit
VLPATAFAELNTIQAGIASQLTETPQLAALMTRLDTQVIGRTGIALVLILVATALVVVGLWLNLTLWFGTRLSERRHEIALRSALGASPQRLMLLAFFEGGLVVGTAAAIAAVIAVVVFRVITTNAPPDLPRLEMAHLNRSIVLWGIGVALVMSFLVISMQTRTALGKQFASTLRGGSRTGAVKSSRFWTIALTMEAAIGAFVLLATALILVSYINVMRVDKGFRPGDAFAIDVSLPAYKYRTPEDRLKYYQQVLEVVRRSNSVVAVGVVSKLPLSGESFVDSVNRPDQALPGDEAPMANIRFIGGDYFGAIGLETHNYDPFAKARVEDLSRPEQTTASSQTWALVSTKSANTLWQESEVIGRPLLVGGLDTSVAGTVDDVKSNLEKDTELVVYLPLTVNTPNRASVVVRPRMSIARPSDSDIVREVRAVDPDVAIREIYGFKDLEFASSSWRRYHLTMVSVLAAIALFSTCLGIHGITTLFAQSRRKEIAIRQALGGSSVLVILDQLRKILTPVAAGMVTGLLLGLVSMRVVNSLFFDVWRGGVGFAIGAIVFLLVVAVVAALGPIVASVRQPILETLRQE